MITIKELITALDDGSAKFIESIITKNHYCYFKIVVWDRRNQQFYNDADVTMLLKTLGFKYMVTSKGERLLKFNLGKCDMLEYEKLFRERLDIYIKANNVKDVINNWTKVCYYYESFEQYLMNVYGLTEAEYNKLKG